MFTLSSLARGRLRDTDAQCDHKQRAVTTLDVQRAAWPRSAPLVRRALRSDDFLTGGRATGFDVRIDAKLPGGVSSLLIPRAEVRYFGAENPRPLLSMRAYFVDMPRHAREDRRASARKTTRTR